jgi:proton-translocating NADH-quinone oxidoreductase chain N
LGCANDLFNLWVWFEAMAVSSYLLVAFYHEQPASLESGVKYLVQSAAGSILVLLGIALVFAQTGTLNLDQIQAAAAVSANTTGLLVAGALFLIGFGVKAALVPMHTWLPDAHSQAPSGISAMLSGVVIEAGLVALLRAIAPLVSVTLSWGTLLLAFSALNMLAGNLLALRQTQVKRLLAFSSLAHVGYMLLGLGIAVYAGQAAGAEGSFFHLVNHGLMKGLAFLAAGALLYVLYIARGSHNPLTTADLAGAAKRYPLPALALSIAVLGLGGLPPLAGFTSKWQIFVAGFQTQNTLIVALVIFAALNSVLSLGYYAPLVNAMYRQQPSAAMQGGKSMPVTMTIPLVLLALAIIVIGVWPTILQWLTAPAGAALLAAFGK